MSDLTVFPTHLQFMHRRFPRSVGKGGITDHKVEGDGATPRGTHRIVGMFYRPDRITPPAPWAMPIGPRDLWSDASGQADYNHHVRAPYPYSHEKLRRADPLYDLVLVTDWNWPDAEAGKGSAIFIHRWRKPGHPTEGCIGLRPADLRWIAERVTPASRLIVR
ncbi:L,D-transpeptidase family protein [Thalassorhabdomicrobium marinisediminis]|uniref:L,D-transpeptidase family protein n=1 Tax=Thalassorhabdomicrobium marinisediminis TaxID=2170577 RepID=UPI00248F526F|nr:L,D-transpeptidase family protein [Thalassorhabdomicrobium marinisediminis]